MLPLTPTKHGRYEIVDEIGKGAMGVVYLARDPLIGRLVALKTFRIGYSVKDQELEQFRIRFMREAQSAGILTHPHIVTIHDVVEASEEGLAFIAMEYVRGTNLKLLLQGEQPMSLPFALDIVSQVGDALDYAHANRVIHRDVKPANILITTDNRVKITDFGIARLESSNLTQEGQLLGTPNYMAPEQIQGKEVDHRADLFSLGIVLYEMLTRHKPFQGENLTVVSHRIVYDHFTPPREYVRDLPPGVDRILARALEKDPARRYQRAKELVEDLRQVAEATTARRDDLNETQSLSSTMVLPPEVVPPPAAPVSPATATGTGSTGAADLADTVETAAPAPPPARPRSSPRRLLAAGAVALMASLLVWTALLLWTGWSSPGGRQRNAAEDANRVRVMDLVQEGKLAQNAGNWSGAAFLYRKAEELEPKAKGIQRLRETAERNAAQASQQQASKESVVAMEINTATQALLAQSWDAALAAATAAMQIDPNNLQARAIMTQAQDGKGRQSRQRSPQAPRNRGDQMASATPLTSAEAPHPGTPEPSSQVDSGTASIHIHIKAETEGTVVVSVGGRELWRKSFERSGIFRGRRLEQTEADRTMDIPGGSVEFRVIIAPTGKSALVKTVPQTLRGGSSHRMDVLLAESGGSATFN